MSRFSNGLLASVAGLALLPCLACAQQVPADAAAEGTGDDIVVYGFGETRQVQTVTARDLTLLTPGTTPLKAVQKLPGVNFQSADPFGAYEWSTRISLRGFNQNQLGFTLDGVPLGDMSYGNHNGLHLSRAIISENTGTVSVSQGAGALGTASSSNLGGTLEFISRDPSQTMDLAGSLTYGSEQTFRAFVRGETGDLGGVRGYLSYAFIDAGKWKGDGRQRQHQVNGKVVAEIGGATVTGFLNFSDRRENDYQDMSADMITRLGRDWDNFAPDWASAYNVAAIHHNQEWLAANGSAFPQSPVPYPGFGFTFPAPVTSVDDAYFNASGLRRDWLGGLSLDMPVTEQISFKLQGYYHDNEGQGLWWTPYVQSPTGAPISVRTTEYDIQRPGVIGRVIHDLGFNHFEVGGWYERNDFRQARRFYSLDNVLTGSSRDSLKFQRNPFFTQWDFDFTTDTYMYYVMDRLDISDMFSISGGWKGLRIDATADPIVQDTLAAGSIEAEDWFLPQVGLLVRFGDKAELFANYNENMRAYQIAATSGPFSTTQLGFNAIADSLKPETSQTYEIGGRVRAGKFQGSVAGYYVDFQDRLLAVSSGPSIVGSPSILQNVGNVRTYGVEVAGTYQPIPSVSLTASYAYNDSTYRDDVGAAAIKGKTVVDSPKHIASAEIAYDSDILFGRVGANYMSKRYYTYTNDRSVDGRVVVDLSLGIKFPGEGWMSGWALEGSVTNLFDEDYISTVGSGGFANSDPAGTLMTLLPGAPQQFYITIRRGF